MTSAKLTLAIAAVTLAALTAVAIIAAFVCAFAACWQGDDSARAAAFLSTAGICVVGAFVAGGIGLAALMAFEDSE